MYRSQSDPKFDERVTSLGRRGVLLPSSIHGIWHRALDAPVIKQRLWIHGDLHPLNVLVKDGRLAALIDWGDMAGGDPATDLACFWSLLQSRASRARALRSYASCSDDLVLRAQGWAALLGVVLLDSGLEDSPRHARIGEQIVRALDEDARSRSDRLS